jgi:hypothetical protein
MSRTDRLPSPMLVLRRHSVPDVEGVASVAACVIEVLTRHGHDPQRHLRQMQEREPDELPHRAGGGLEDRGAQPLEGKRWPAPTFRVACGVSMMPAHEQASF